MSQPLFALIKSLTPTEKGYIKKSGAKSGKGSHLSIIIDEFSKLKDYDEMILNKRLGKKMELKNLAKYKIDAQNIIQKRLTLFHEEKQIEIKLRSQFNQGIVLHKKGLFDLAIRQYEKTLKTALEYEEFSVALSIYYKLLSLYYAGKLGVEFPYMVGFQSLVKTMSGENKIQELNTGLAEILFADHLSEQEKLDRIASIKTSADAIENTDGFITKWGQFCINTHSNYLLKNHEASNKSNKIQLEFLAEYPLIHEKDPLRYVKHLINYINGKFNVSAYEEIPALLEKLRTLHVGDLSDHCNFMKWSCYYIHAISYHLQTGDFQGAKKVLAEGDPWFEKEEAEVPDYFKLLFYDAAFITEFGNGNYKAALQQLNKLSNYKSQFRRELQISVKFYNIILHFELENFDLIGSKIRSLYRELKTHQPQLSKESETIKWIRKGVEKVSNKIDFKKIAPSLSRELRDLHKGEDHSLMYFPFLVAWLDSFEDPESFYKTYSEFYLK